MSLKCQKKARSSSRDFIRKAKSLYYATAKKDQSRGLAVALIKTFGLGFGHIKINA